MNSQEKTQDLTIGRASACAGPCGELSNRILPLRLMTLAWMLAEKSEPSWLGCQKLS
jgi:hypothetical protein